MTGEPTHRRNIQIAYNPEFVDAKGLEELFGIKRALAYHLMGEGRIKTVSLKRPSHPHRGKRLFEVASVRAYLHQQMEETNGEKQ